MIDIKIWATKKIIDSQWRCDTFDILIRSLIKFKFYFHVWIDIVIVHGEQYCVCGVCIVYNFTYAFGQKGRFSLQIYYFTSSKVYNNNISSEHHHLLTYIPLPNSGMLDGMLWTMDVLKKCLRSWKNTMPRTASHYV